MTRLFPALAPDARGLWIKQSAPECDIVHDLRHHRFVVAVGVVFAVLEPEHPEVTSLVVAEVELERLLLVRDLRAIERTGREVPACSCPVTPPPALVRPSLVRAGHSHILSAQQCLG